MVVHGIEIGSLSAEEARDLILRLQWHVRCEDASMTPDELREHLKELPVQLLDEATTLSWKIRNEIGELVMDYVLRRGNWDTDDAYEQFGDDEGEVDPDRVYAEFRNDIERLESELIDALFGRNR